MEFSDHNTVVSTFITAMKDDKGEDPINYHKSELPLYKIDELGEEDWKQVNRILSEPSWIGIPEMPAKKLQNLIIDRYVEAIKKIAQRKTNKKMKKKTPIHLKRFIRMKRKAGKQLRQLENLTEEKIKKVTERIRVADVGLQNAARFKQEKEEKKLMKK